MPAGVDERFTVVLEHVTPPELEAVTTGGKPVCVTLIVDVAAPGQAPPLPVITTV